MKVTINLTKQEAIDALLQFYKHTGATEIVILDDEQVETDDEWISNIGRDKYDHPENLDPNTQIEVKFRDGGTDAGYADSWSIWWKDSGEEGAIVAYRVI